MSLGERLRGARERKGLTQEAVAARVGAHEQQVSKWERGVHAPSGAALAKLAGLYDTSVDDLLSGDAESTQRPELSEPDGAPLSPEAIGEMRGRLATTVEWLHSLGDQVNAFGTSVRGIEESLKALRASMDRAANGVAHVVASGALGSVSSLPNYPRPTAEQIARAERELEADVAALKAAQTAHPASRAG